MFVLSPGKVHFRQLPLVFVSDLVRLPWQKQVTSVQQGILNLDKINLNLAQLLTLPMLRLLPSSNFELVANQLAHHLTRP